MFGDVGLGRGWGKETELQREKDETHLQRSHFLLQELFSCLSR